MFKPCSLLLSLLLLACTFDPQGLSGNGEGNNIANNVTTNKQPIQHLRRVWERTHRPWGGVRRNRSR